MLRGILKPKREIHSKAQVNIIKILPQTYRIHQIYSHIQSVAISRTEGPMALWAISPLQRESHDCRAVQTWPGELTVEMLICLTKL